MLYPKLVEMAHRHLGVAADLVKSAAMFYLDIAPHQSLAKFSDEPTLAWMRREFRLPYPVTGIEDRASCIILAERPTPGLEAERVFIECLPGDMRSTDAGAFSDTPDAVRQIEGALQEAPRGSVIVTLGTFCVAGLSHEGFMVGGRLQRAVCGTPDRLLWLIDDPDPEDPALAPMCAAALTNAMTAIEEIIHIQRLPGFTGWPRDVALGNQFHDVEPNGRIVPTRRGRVA